MASGSSPPPMPFADFPEDVQLSILSFLSLAEISAFACTSRRSASLCSQPKLWYAVCDRRWGSKTLINSWGGGGVPFDRLYRTLDTWENLIGFWRQIGKGVFDSPPLVFFEWGPSFITGSRVSPSKEPGSYGVLKKPFLWMGLSSRGQPLSVLHQGTRFESGEDISKLASSSGLSGPELIPVNVSFVGGSHFVLEENRCFNVDGPGADEDLGASEDSMFLESSSPPDRLMLDVYQYFANRTSPGSDRSSRKQRKKERGRIGRRKWEAEHFVKIANSYPTPLRPLQGLWKGICKNMSLGFYLVMYDDSGGLSCRRVGDALEPFSGYSPVFWTLDAASLESPFPSEEEDLYNLREHIKPAGFSCSSTEKEVISRILCITTSYDLVIPDPPGLSANLRNVEGRIWEYKSGTFGFGFLRNNFIIDLKHIVQDGCLLDATECWAGGPSS